MALFTLTHPNSFQNWLAFFLVFTLPYTSARSQFRPYFQGSAVVESLSAEGDQHQSRLLNGFSYVDATGKTWQIPAGTLIDESTLPNWLWAPVNLPLTDAYRDATILHTYYCKSKKENWFFTHRMFYEACLTAGIAETRAKILFAAVFANVQRWTPVYGKSSISSTTLSFQGYQLYTVSILESDFNQIIGWIEKTNPGLDEIVVQLHCLVKTIKVKRLLKPISDVAGEY